MKFDFNKSQTFQRYSRVLNKNELVTHLYMPWAEESNPEFLFQIKKKAKDSHIIIISGLIQTYGSKISSLYSI